MRSEQKWIIPCVGTYRPHKWKMVCCNVCRCILCDNIDVDWTQMQYLGADRVWRDFDNENEYTMFASWMEEYDQLRVRPKFGEPEITGRVYPASIDGPWVAR